MDIPGASTLQSLQQVKADLKQWERQFQMHYFRVPSKADVQACASIQQLYRQYASLKTKMGKENLHKDEKINVKPDANDFIVKGNNAQLTTLERPRLRPLQPTSSSDDSSCSHISDTPTKPVPEKCESQPFHGAHSGGTRKPLQLISSNDGNKMSAFLNSCPNSSNQTRHSGISEESKTAIKVEALAPKKLALNPAVNLSFGSAATQQKALLPASLLALEGGLVIRLHRHGGQLKDRQSSLSEDPLPAGFFSSCGRSSLIRKDLERCRHISVEDAIAKDGDSASPSPVTTFVNMENQGIIDETEKRHGFLADQPPCADLCHRTQPNTPSSVGVEVLSKLVSDELCSQAERGNESEKTTDGLGDASVEKKGLLQKTGVVLLKQMLLKRGLPVTGSKSILISRLEDALVTEKQEGHPAVPVYLNLKIEKQRQIENETTDAKRTKFLKRKLSKDPKEQDVHIFLQPDDEQQAVSSMTVEVLKQMLLRRGLPLKGNKSTLITRLQEAMFTEDTEKSATAGDVEVKPRDNRQTNERAADIHRTNASKRKDIEDPEEWDGQNARPVERRPTMQSLNTTSASGNVVRGRITRSMLRVSIDKVSADSPENSIYSCSHSDNRRSEQLPGDTSNTGNGKPLKPAEDSPLHCEREASTKQHATESIMSDASNLVTVTAVKSLQKTSAVESYKVMSVIKGSNKRVKITEALENSWTNPKMLQKGSRFQKGRNVIPSRHRQRLCARPGERDNFVRLNINGKGKRRKFLNGTRTRQRGAYGRRGTQGARSRTKNKGGAADKVLADDGNDFNLERGCQPEENCGPAGHRMDSLWTDEGWLTTNASSDGSGDNKCNSYIDEFIVQMKDIVEAQKCPSDKGLSEVLRLVFGFRAFQTGQLEAVKRVLSMQSTMVILPTGAGKSLCYQLPAYLLPGISLVISPLKALMNDQLRRLPPSLPGAVICSGQTPQESSATITRLRAGQVKVLFISPERLFSESFFCTLGELPKISLAVIDEAHCLSEWSHNFRPSYFRLGKVLHQRMKVPCVVAMTATATKKAEQSILKSLHIPADGVVQASHVRQNLSLTVSRESNRLRSLLSMLQTSPYADAKSVIIYCTFQAETDYLSGYLQQNGIQAKSYHAKKISQERNRIYDLFCNNKLRVVVATVAFGMGLDKSDVRAIVHYNMPRSLEHYVQETGRAGRDGNSAYCHLFLDDGDYLKLRSLAYSDGVDEYSVNKFLSRVFVGSASTRPGNPVSIVIESASRELDIKEEVMETILSYLEVGEVEYVKVLSKLNATCTLSFHRSSPASLAGRNTFVASIIKRSKEKQGRYVFDITSIATQLHLSLFEVQSELRKLQIPVDICLLTSKITKRLIEAEECQVKKIDAMYLAASAAVQTMKGEGAWESNVSISGQEPSLQTYIKSYFEEEEASPVSKNLPGIIQTNSAFVQADIKVFLKSVRNPNLTGRAVARIFHGLWSPAFPYLEWSKNHFWGQHARVDFEVIKQAAAAQILSQHATNRNHFQP